MKKLLDISPDLTVAVHSISAIKRGASDEQSVVFLKGQSSLEGFVVEREYEQLTDEWERALEDEE